MSAEKKNLSRLVARFPRGEFDALSTTIDRFGGSQLFVERLVRWFEAQDDVVKAVIQGQIPMADEELLELILRRKGKPIAPSKVSGPQIGRKGR
jgi:hypothetical protein